jgi:hypothetical protein
MSYFRIEIDDKVKAILNLKSISCAVHTPNTIKVFLPVDYLLLTFDKSSDAERITNNYLTD